MAPSATVAFTRSPSALFTPSEVQGLMAVEFERARRYGYAICCLTLRPDRLSAMTTVHGDETRVEILNTIIDLVRTNTRAGDLLGYVVEDRIVALLPHTRLQDARFLCDRLLADVQTLRFDGDASTHRISLSIGVSHNQHPGASSFEILEEVSREGLTVAENSGGGRWAETDLYDLYAPKAPLPAPQQVVGASADSSPFNQGEYRERLEALVSADGDLEAAAAALAEEILGRALAESQAAREAADMVKDSEVEAQLSEAQNVSDYEREIDQLRRRVAKLTSSLGITERELSRLRSEGFSEEGIASIYRDVQGLGGNGEHAELKQDLMNSIFQANLDLQVRQAG